MIAFLKQMLRLVCGWTWGSPLRVRRGCDTLEQIEKLKQSLAISCRLSSDHLYLQNVSSQRTNKSLHLYTLAKNKPASPPPLHSLPSTSRSPTTHNAPTGSHAGTTMSPARQAFKHSLNYLHTAAHLVEAHPIMPTSSSAGLRGKVVSAVVVVTTGVATALWVCLADAGWSATGWVLLARCCNQTRWSMLRYGSYLTLRLLSRDVMSYCIIHQSALVLVEFGSAHSNPMQARYCCGA